MAVPGVQDMAASAGEIRSILTFFARHVRALADGELSYCEQPVRGKLEDIRQAIEVWARGFGLDLDGMDLEELAEYVEGLAKGP